MRISDWSSDVCSSDLMRGDVAAPLIYTATMLDFLSIDRDRFDVVAVAGNSMGWYSAPALGGAVSLEDGFRIANAMGLNRSEEHTPAVQSLMRHTYAVFCLK